MLAREVVDLIRKSVLLLAALLLTLGANLRPSCEYELDGERIAPGCGLRTAARAERAAQAAAEEILPGAVPARTLKRRVRLRLRRPEGDARLLADALLRATQGVVSRCEVRVDGRRLGWVEDGDALCEALSAYIRNTLPTWASGGVLSRELAVRRLYTRAGYLTPERDMLLLVTGAAPVFYYDTSGRYARA